MGSFRHYANLWLTSARYCIMRMLMFRGDFFVWALVELFWMTVNLLMVSIIYRHTDTVAGWTKYEMMLLVGTSLLIQRFLMGFFCVQCVLAVDFSGSESLVAALPRWQLCVDTFNENQPNYFAGAILPSDTPTTARTRLAGFSD